MDFIRREKAAFNSSDQKENELIVRMQKIDESYNDGDLFATSFPLIKFLVIEIYFDRYKKAEQLHNTKIAKTFENIGRWVAGCQNTLNHDLESARAKLEEIRGEEKNYKFNARLEIAIRVIFGYFIGLMIDLSKLVVGNTDFYCIKTNARVIREINDAWNTFDRNYNQLGVTA